ncbi:hypothetical protein H0H93_010714 [Arthromyces matolae]|nr:hypothetical protein H0H93_010714 [Arthromyces matolae]
MPQLIFVTGASGFLGSHIVLQLLSKGFNVRAAARGPRVSELTEIYKKLGYADRVSIVEIADISKGDFSEVFQGVDGVIHAAAPIGLDGGVPTETMLASNIEGTINVVRQAEKAGITRIVVTASIVNVMHDQSSITDKDWNPVTKEEAVKMAGNDAYRAAKTLAEKALWEFANSHPHVEITTLLPPLMYGPLAASQPIPTGSYNAISTDIFIYRLLHTDGFYPIMNLYLDIRDCARAHILALDSPPTSVVGHKRIIILSPTEFNNKAAVEYIGDQRPELKERLITKASQDSAGGLPSTIDFGRIEQVLGLKKEDFRTMNETVLDTVDSLLALEKKWVEEGHEINIPLGDGTLP